MKEGRRKGGREGEEKRGLKERRKEGLIIKKESW